MQLVEPVERAQRPVLHQPAARRVHGLLAVAGARRLRQARRARCAASSSSPATAARRGRARRARGRRACTAPRSQEFFDGLPDDVVCNAGVFAQHAYAKRGDRGRRPAAPSGSSRTSSTSARARRTSRSGSPRRGVGGPHVGDERSPGPRRSGADCRALDVVAAPLERRPARRRRFQYTFRDDPRLPGRPGRRQARRRRGRPTTCSGVGRRPQARRAGAATPASCRA